MRRVVSGLARLMRNERGNTFLITAAITLPLLLLVGSGIDLSRTYMTKNKLQQACDAGVLAGRKVYTGSIDTLTTNEVKKYVNFDFPQGTSDTAPFTITPTNGGAGTSTVNLSLSTTIPMTIMKLVGFTTLPVNVSCTARQDFVNTDVMLVLDTTGSMNCLPSDSAGASCPTEKSGSKIQGLRAAVTSFYNALKPAQDQLETAGLRMRYGIVPYSSNVNVGKLLFQTNTNWLNQWGSYRNSSCRSTTVSASCPTKVDHGAVSTSTTWWNNWVNGANTACIEEVATNNSITASSGYTAPSNAYDVDINFVPSGASNTSTPNPKAWTAFDPTSETAKNSGTGYAACPDPAYQLQRVADVSTINTYTAGLTAEGGTYHDVGMAWGGRLLSQTGLWASNNPVTYNSFPVNRHLIFMTDGDLAPNSGIYSAWGIEAYDRRVTGSNVGNDYDSHLQRFRMLCNAIKGSNVTIWVVQFGVSAGAVTPDMQNCASSPSNAFAAADSATLNAQFTQIGQSIGALRLSQ